MLLGLSAASILIVRMLGVQGRGEVAAAVLIPTIVSYGGNLGLPTAAGYLLNASPTYRSSIIATSRTLAIILSGIMSVVSLGLIFILPLPSEVQQESAVFIPFVLFNTVRLVHETLLQADIRTVALSIDRLTGVLTYLLILISLDLFGRPTVMSVVVAQMAGAFTWFVISTALTASRPWFAFDKAIFRDLSGYGMRAHLGNASPLETLRLDQLILALFLSAYDLGLYTMAMSFVVANRTIGASIGTIAFPLAARPTSVENLSRRVVFGALTLASILLTAILATLEIIFGRELLSSLFNVANSPQAYTVLSILAVGSVAMSASQVCTNILRGLGRPGTTSIGELISALTVAIGAVAFRSYGVVGIATAVSLAAAVQLAFLLVAGLAGGHSK